MKYLAQPAILRQTSVYHQKILEFIDRQDIRGLKLHLTDPNEIDLKSAANLYSGHIQLIAKILKTDPTITGLDLSNNNTIAPMHFSNLLLIPTLSRLKLQDNKLDIKSFIENLSKSNITMLDIANCGLDSEDYRSIAAVLPKCLKDLNMKDNYIIEESNIFALLDLIQNNQMKALKLSYDMNKSDKISKYFTTNEYLKKFDIKHNLDELSNFVHTEISVEVYMTGDTGYPYAEL